MTRPAPRSRTPVVPLARRPQPAIGRLPMGRGRIGRPSAFEMACACVADNDNSRPTGMEERLLIGLALGGPMLASLGMVALMFGLSG